MKAKKWLEQHQMLSRQQNRIFVLQGASLEGLGDCLLPGSREGCPKLQRGQSSQPRACAEPPGHVGGLTLIHVSGGEDVLQVVCATKGGCDCGGLRPKER